MKHRSSSRFALVAGAMFVLASVCPADELETVGTLAETARASGPLPFPQVLQATTGHRLLTWDTSNPAHAALQSRLISAATNVLESVRTNPIRAARPNEAGTRIEAMVRDALKQAGLAARTPVTSNGRAQATGYPDIEIPGDPHCYLELKTYSAAALTSSQRTFYYSPSDTPKVTRDAVHLLLAFELERQTADGETLFVPVHWQLLSLETLTVEMKLEFNQSNRGLYGHDAGPRLIGEGHE